jgi:hypothetical protein
MSRRRATSSKLPTVDQPELPLAGAPRAPRGLGLDPDEAAKLAIVPRAKSGAPTGHVRLVLTLELRQAPGGAIEFRFAGA